MWGGEQEEEWKENNMQKTIWPTKPKFLPAGLNSLSVLIYVRGWQFFSMNVQTANILGFAGHTIPVTIIQMCHQSVKAATDNM